MMPHTKCHIVYGITRVMIIWRSLLIVATPYAPLSSRLSMVSHTRFAGLVWGVHPRCTPSFLMQSDLCIVDLLCPSSLFLLTKATPYHDASHLIPYSVWHHTRDDNLEESDSSIIDFCCPSSLFFCRLHTSILLSAHVSLVDPYWCI